MSLENLTQQALEELEAAVTAMIKGREVLPAVPQLAADVDGNQATLWLAFTAMAERLTNDENIPLTFRQVSTAVIDPPLGETVWALTPQTDDLTTLTELGGSDNEIVGNRGYYIRRSQLKVVHLKENMLAERRRGQQVKNQARAAREAARTTVHDIVTKLREIAEAHPDSSLRSNALLLLSGTPSTAATIAAGELLGIPVTLHVEFPE